MDANSLIAGIDGCKAGWFVVAATRHLDAIRLFVAPSISDAVSELPDSAVIGIDIPIGVPDAGPRQCDFLARRLLSPGRASCVFPAPVRPVLGVRDYRQACDIRESIDGKRMSAQAFNILHKIDEVDRFVRENPKSRLVEVHPELAFAVMNHGEPMRFAKRKPEGFDERFKHLAKQLNVETLDDALQAYPRSQVAKDDVLDAFAVLLSAARIVDGEGCRVPEKPCHDSAGIDMAIWY